MVFIPKTYYFILAVLITGIATISNDCFANDRPHSFLTSSVGNFVWNDYDRNGKQDPGERGVANVEIVLYDGNNQILTTVYSDASGYYLFNGLNTEPGGKVFQILFKLPIGYLFSPHKATGFADTENSDADEATGKSNLFTLLPGQANFDLDAGLIGPNGTLPLHRLNLHTILIANQVQVTWEAENELNTSVFIVQRSINGVNFTDIASKPPVGPVNTLTTYQVIDKMLGLTNPSCLYYRIKAMDSDGRVAYSRITMIKFSMREPAMVWPNPFVDRFNLTYNASVSTSLEISLTNLSGKIVRQLNLNVNPGYNQILLKDLEQLSSGIYFIRIYDKNTNEIYVRKISK